jgi:Secretion system C-terminal sorting domain
MKKIFLLIASVLFISANSFAQSIKVNQGLLSSSRIKQTRALTQKVNASNNLPNASFETWTVDSIESFSGNTIRFAHPEMWAPINGIFIAYFLDLDIPISAVLNGPNTAVKIEIADMGFGSDLGTVISTNARPKALNGQFEFNGASTSTAFFEIIATKYNAAADSSEVIGAGFFQADENTTGGFKNFQATIDYVNQTDIPDSIYVFASYLEGDLGTWFKFDNLNLDYTSTGLQSEKSSLLSVYPNPSKDQIQIGLTNNTELIDASVEIRGIDGSLKLKLTNYQSKEMIDISSLASGMYILTVQDASGVMSKKINKI